MARQSPFSAPMFINQGILFTPPPCCRFAQPIRETSTEPLLKKIQLLTEAWSGEPATDQPIVEQLQFLRDELRRRNWHGTEYQAQTTRNNQGGFTTKTREVANGWGT